LVGSVESIAGQTRGSFLRVATYNLQNYTATGRMTPEGYQSNYPKPEASKRALHAVLGALQADVLLVQEIGSEAYLQELRRDLSQLGQVYEHGGVVEADDEERKLGFLSKLPAKTQRHGEIAFTYQGEKVISRRGLLEVQLDTPAGPLLLFGVHLKSRITERSDDPEANLYRGAEATALRERVLLRQGQTGASLILVAGDFNDLKGTRPLRAFLRKGDRELLHLVQAGDSRGETWTHHHARQDSYTRIDHVLVSPELLPRVRAGALGTGPAATICDHPEWAKASDHRPLLVELDLSPGTRKVSIQAPRRQDSAASRDDRPEQQ